MENGDIAPSARQKGETLISVRGLTKRFGATQVLHGIDLDIGAGEVIVLLGPNGAGKSTLLNIIGGTLQPTSGTLAFGTEVVDPGSYGGGAARARGIQRVFQELSTFPNLTVAENMALTHEGAAPSRRALLRDARNRMQAFPKSAIAVDEPLSNLSIAERQMVEIARAMTEPGTRLVILDEPTSALSAAEAEQLTALVQQKAAEGVAIIYVTHKLEEAIRLADRVVVLRDGHLHFDGPGQGLTHDRLLALLGAAPAQDTGPTTGAKAPGGAEVLAVDGFSAAELHDIRIHVGAGEIVGLAGLEGAGQRELLQAVFDARGHQGRAIRSASDIAYVSGDRKREGLLPIWTVQQNVEISALPHHSRAGFVEFGGLRAAAQGWLQELGLAHRASSPIVSLSGGNQQRALLGRALASEAPLLLLDDPTRGVDAGAKASIYAILGQIKRNGRSAILYSTEVAEFAQCDRVYVMARGHVVAEFTGADASAERIVHASFLDPAQVKGRQPGPVAPSGVAHGRQARGFWTALAGWPALPAAALMLAMFTMAFVLQPRALSTFGLELLLQASVPLAFAVIAQMLFLLGGDIDLGLGFAIGLANVLAATYLVDAPMIGILALAGLIAGYALLAVIVELLSVSSVVATLGASFVWLGAGLMLRETPGGVSPDWLTDLARIRLWPLPLACYVLVGVALLGLWLSKGWGYSIRLRALGHNRRTYLALGYSALAGRVTVYTLAGLFAVVAGLLITGTTGAGNVNVAAGYTLSTVAAVVVGGASFAGGLVSPLGAVMAVVGISLINTNLSFMGISSDYTAALGGLVLILALSFRSLTQRGAR